MENRALDEGLLLSGRLVEKFHKSRPLQVLGCSYLQLLFVFGCFEIS